MGAWGLEWRPIATYASIRRTAFQEQSVIESSQLLPGRATQVEHAPRIQSIRRWQPTSFIRTILALHVLGLVALAFEPGWWAWFLGGFASLQMIIALIVPFPRNAWLGGNITRLPAAATMRNEIALTFDDGPCPDVTPQVLDLLEARGMRATFFCVAKNAEAYPELVREIVRRGHHVENHSHRHSLGFALYGYGRLARDVDAAQATLTDIAKRAPRFFRAPAGIRSPFLDPILQRRGLRHIAWTRRGFDAVERNPSRVLSRLTRNLAGGDVLLLHDGGAAHARDGKPVVLHVLPTLLDEMRQRGLTSVTLSAAFAEYAPQKISA